jgi:hypothetical protein
MSTCKFSRSNANYISIKMNIFDYSFSRFYYWYKRRKPHFTHQKLCEASNYAISIISAYLSAEISFAISTIIQTQEYIYFIAILLGLYPAFGFSYRYLNPERAQTLVENYREITDDDHERIRSNIFSYIVLIQLFCMFCFFYHSTIVTSVINQLKNYF